MPDSTLTISEIKTEILQRVRERQASIERGEYEVPLRYTPLPWAAVSPYSADQ